MQTITKRPAMIGSHVNGRGEHHGEDTVTALDIPLSDIMLSAEELNALLHEPLAHGLLFQTRQGGAYIEPIFRMLRPFRLVDKVEGAAVTLEINPGDVLRLTDCKLSRLTLQPMPGGLTSLSLLVQCTPALDSSAARLLGKLNTEVAVEIVFQLGRQDELGLPDAGEGDELDDAA